MKKIVTLVLAAALLAPIGTGLATGTAYAQKAHSNRAANTNPRVTVIIIRDYIGPDDFQQVPMTYRFPSAQTYAKGQEEIRNVPNIRAALQKRGIPARNVNGVQTAFNGGKIVYVK
ncbi:hypothetical protein OE766_17185 [Pararhizobium sp. YC-54]|uniref:hypothetical protein n=1 Tax=Pararhizobium sp. YC-54 TaxID=2986920 RepID=UPI0021F7E9A1|nr:hypothetical protein [Pararhizobium sp. YC-54]MCV9999974.1 hypothetical protein [Pararhizobium sp. YC-54]